jgi:hypothetical protein
MRLRVIAVGTRMSAWVEAAFTIMRAACGVPTPSSWWKCRGPA